MSEENKHELKGYKKQYRQNMSQEDKQKNKESIKHTEKNVEKVDLSKMKKMILIINFLLMKVMIL